jgi:predicted nucleic acid-binding protein
MDSFTVESVSCEPNVLEIASRIKAQAGLSVADSWIGATAIAYDATLVHKDREFESFREIPQEILK